MAIIDGAYSIIMCVSMLTLMAKMMEQMLAFLQNALARMGCFDPNDGHNGGGGGGGGSSGNGGGNDRGMGGGKGGGDNSSDGGNGGSADSNDRNGYGGYGGDTDHGGVGGQWVWQAAWARFSCQRLARNTLTAWFMDQFMDTF